MKDSQIISLLLYKHMQGTLSEEEEHQLHAWLNASAANRMLFEELSDEETLSQAIAGYHPQNRFALENRILEKISTERPVTKVKPLYRKLMVGAAVAAAVLLVLSVGTYFLFVNNETKQEIVNNGLPADVEAPKSAKAVITLADGSKLYLDSVGNGTLATQGNSRLVKMNNGQISYEAVSGEVPLEIQYNTLENPRGSNVINMTLADGSKVWLNAGSSVTFPVAFGGNERKVSVSGEAYFEVAKNARQPFRVMIGNETQVEVLGTHFNINAYDDEPVIKTTLLEGSVKITRRNDSKILRPGQQAVSGESITINDRVDIEQVMAWKNGIFNFEGVQLDEFMRQLARWYDLEISYTGAVPKRTFRGKLGRDLNLSEVMEVLTHFNIKYKREGKILIIE